MQTRPTYQVRNIERGFWTFDLYFPYEPPQYSVGEVHGDEREARRRARAAIQQELDERAERGAYVTGRADENPSYREAMIAAGRSRQLR